MKHISSFHLKLKDFIVEFTDGSSFSFPRSRYLKLSRATDAQLRNYRLIGSGEGIHWPEIDEDLSAEGLWRDRYKGGKINN